MMAWFLNLAYLVGLVVALPWLLYQAIARAKYREGWAEKLLGLVPQRLGRQPCVWFHAVSVGEVNLLAPLIERLCRSHPEWECVISTTTATGMAVARTKFPEILVFYCPLDFSWAVQRAIRRIRPNILVLVELEIWPNLIRFARKFGVKVVIINGRLGNRSFQGYQRLGGLIRSVLRDVDGIAAQNAVYADRFQSLGADRKRILITGSMKYDGVETNRSNPSTCYLRGLAHIGDEDVVFLAGSTQEPEEALALETFRSLSEEFPRLRLILVPRHPHRFESVVRLLEESALNWQRRSQLIGRGHNPEARILLIDTIGELRAWWGVAQIAFVGGSLGNRGGQNMIEPAAYGAAVCFGPKTWNFRDIASALVEREAAKVVHNGEELTLFVRWCLERPDLAAEMGERAKRFVLTQQGATERTLKFLEAFMEQGRVSRSIRSAA